MALTKVIGAGLGSVSSADLDGAVTINESSADKDFRVESNGNANMLFVDGGTDTVIIGHNVTRTTLFNTTANAALQIEGTSGNTAAMSIARNSNDDNGPQLVLAKSNGTAGAAVTVVTDDALLGRISWQGADGTQTVEAARIEGFVDGTPGANDMPGRLTFSTTADGAATVTERVRIHTNGVASFNNGIALGVGIANTASNVLDDYEEGTWTPTLLGSSSNPSVSYTSNNFGGYTKIGDTVHAFGRINTTSVSGGSGTALIGGLLFTTHNGSPDIRNAGALGYISNVSLSTGYTQFGLSPDANTNTIRLVQSGSGVGGNIISVGVIGNAFDCPFTLTYKV